MTSLPSGHNRSCVSPRPYPIAFKRLVQITPEDKYRQEYRYDVARTLRFFLFGAGMSKCPLHFCGAGFSCDRASLGPVIGRWNKYLEVKFPLRTRREGAINFAALFKRVAVDQIVMAPIGVRSTSNSIYPRTLIVCDFPAVRLSQFHGYDGRPRPQTHPCQIRGHL